MEAQLVEGSNLALLKLELESRPAAQADVTGLMLAAGAPKPLLPFLTPLTSTPPLPSIQ